MTPLESFTNGQAHAVDFTAIERELASLWKEATAPDEGQVAAGGGAPAALTRACQLNLAVWCAAGEEAARATSIIAQVVRVHPSRVLMAVLDRSAGGTTIEAFISAHCSYAPGAGRGKQVCCEQVTLAASGGAAERLPGAVLPLLLADLPVALWWPGDPELSDPAALRLVAAADRVVIDARRMVDAGAQLRRVAALECPVSDLGWHRLRAWREMTAGLFDGRVYADYPARVDAIEIEHAGGPEAFAEALLLGSWAASRLGWRPGGSPVARPAALRADGPSSFRLARPGGESAALTLRPRPAESPAGKILSFTMQAGATRFSLRRAGSDACVRITVVLPDSCPLPRVARVTPRDEATLLSRCLETGGRDEIYDEALHLAARLLGPDGAPDTV